MVFADNNVNVMSSRTAISSPWTSVILITLAFGFGWVVGSRPSRSSVPRQNHTDAAASRLQIPAGEAVVGFLDMVDGKPSIRAKVGQTVEVSGWAGCTDSKSALTRVEVLVDRHVRAEAITSQPRPDVAAAYSRPDFANSGWRSSFSTDDRDAGQHDLTARAMCGNGEIALLPSFRLEVVK
jgi:hypothetical protein